MCDAWPCCNDTFNLARLDIATGRIIWQRLLKLPVEYPRWGWHCVGIAALPGTDDAVVMLHTIELTHQIAQLWVVRVRSDGSPVWEVKHHDGLFNDVEPEVARPPGFYHNITADHERIYVGTPTTGRRSITDPSIFHAYDHHGNPVEFLVGQVADQAEMPVLADQRGNLYYGRGHSNPTAMVELAWITPDGDHWETSSLIGIGYPACLTPDGHVVAIRGYNQGGTHQMALFDKSNGATIATADPSDHFGVFSATTFRGEVWVGGDTQVHRLNVDDLTTNGEVSTSFIAHDVVAVSDECVIAVGNFGGYFGHIARIDPDGSVRWQVEWGFRSPPDLIVYGPSRIPWQACLTRDGALLVCGEMTSQ